MKFTGAYKKKRVTGPDKNFHPLLSKKLRGSITLKRELAKFKSKYRVGQKKRSIRKMIIKSRVLTRFSQSFHSLPIINMCSLRIYDYGEFPRRTFRKNNKLPL